MKSAVFFLLALCAAAAAAADYPTRPIRVVIGAAPGGPTDTLGRVMGHRIAEHWGQPVVVDARLGAGQSIAADIVAKAAPDGHTLFLGSQAFTANPVLFRKLPYDTLKDFAPVALVAGTRMALVVLPSLPFRTFPELVAYAKANPGKLTYGSAGESSVQRFAMELMRSQLGIDIAHIPYKGTFQAVSALATGDIHLTMSGYISAQGFLATGKMRAIAMISTKRSATMPDLPTAIELGYPGLAADVWFGLLAPAKTPRAIVDRLNAEFNRVLKLPDVRSRFAALDAEPFGSTPEELGTLIRDEMARWAKIARDNNLRPQ